MEFTLAQVLDLIRYAGAVKSALDIASSNVDTVNKIAGAAKPVLSLLETIGAKLFPAAAKEIHAVGGAIAAYDPDTTKWIQGACNSILSLSPALDVDGIYGPLTRDAVTKLQQKLGLKQDGLAGRITQAAVDLWFSKQAKT